MKKSIKSIFKGLNALFIVFAVFAALGAIFSFDHESSYDKTELLYKEKQIILSSSTLPRDDMELTSIQLHGKLLELQNNISKLQEINNKSYAEKYIFSSTDDFAKEISTLSSIIANFKSTVDAFYASTEPKELHSNKLELERIKMAAFSHIDHMVYKSFESNQAKFNLHKNISYGAFIFIIITMLWYKSELRHISSDLEYLCNNMENKGYSIFSQEADAIALRMKRKPNISENPAMIDAATGLKNEKGMMSSYAEKKGMKDNNYTCVALFEVDNFLNGAHGYSKEFIKNSYKKIAFTLSLNEQTTDVIAKNNENQFAVILSRPSKEQLFREVDAIRESIAELSFGTNGTKSLQLTVSGGFVIKPNHVNLDESIAQARKILEYAQKDGKNRIFQVKDMANSDLKA